VWYFPVVQKNWIISLSNIYGVYKDVNSDAIVTDIFGSPPDQIDRRYPAFIGRRNKIKEQLGALKDYVQNNSPAIVVCNAEVEDIPGDWERWNELPPEILTEVFQYFDLETRVRMGGVCTYWQAIVGPMKIEQPYIRLSSNHVINITAFTKRFNVGYLFELYKQAEKCSNNRWANASWIKRITNDAEQIKSIDLSKNMNTLFALEGVIINDTEGQQEAGMALEAFCN